MSRSTRRGSGNRPRSRAGFRLCTQGFHESAAEIALFDSREPRARSLEPEALTRPRDGPCLCVVHRGPERQRAAALILSLAALACGCDGGAARAAGRRATSAQGATTRKQRPEAHEQRSAITADPWFVDAAPQSGLAFTHF